MPPPQTPRSLDIQTFTWPVVVAGLVLFFLIRFHDGIDNFLKRLTGLHGPGELGATAAPPTTQEVPADDPEVPAIAPEVLSEILENLEDQIRQVAEESQQTTQELLRETFIARLELDYERIYREVFGSQVAALRALLEADPAALPREMVELFLENAKSQPIGLPKTWTFERWIGFLLHSGFAGALVEEVENGRMRITDKGRGFLQYIDAANYPP